MNVASIQHYRSTVSKLSHKTGIGRFKVTMIVLRKLYNKLVSLDTLHELLEVIVLFCTLFMQLIMKMFL